MANATLSEAQFYFDESTQVYRCQGSWITTCLRTLSHTTPPTRPATAIWVDRIEALDSAGALRLHQYRAMLSSATELLPILGLSPEQQTLFDLIDSHAQTASYTPTSLNKPSFLYRLGRETVQKLQQIDGLIVLIGDMATQLFQTCLHRQALQTASIVSNLYSAGLQALPILALLSFLIGVVLAYQMGLQLETYGASNFIAYLCGMAIFREFAPLITAIIVAGRTSSSFTAQIGSMKINQEIDALRTMGLSPTEYLVIPKVLALLCIFPLIIFWSDMFSLLGAMIMAKWMLNVGYADFLTRIQHTVGLKQLLLGLYKAPAFALLIALVGCYQGFLVSFSADSVGKQTTKSVVQALFLIIITDALYSIIYSWLNL